MSKTHPHLGKEYPVKTGKMYYQTQNQTYELYFGQWKNSDGTELDGVVVLDAEYILPDDGEMVVLKTFNSTGGVTENASNDVLTAENVRLRQENAALQAQVHALMSQLSAASVNANMSDIVLEPSATADVEAPSGRSQFTDDLAAKAAEVDRAA